MYVFFLFDPFSQLILNYLFLPKYSSYIHYLHVLNSPLFFFHDRTASFLVIVSDLVESLLFQSPGSGPLFIHTDPDQNPTIQDSYSYIPILCSLQFYIIK